MYIVIIITIRSHYKHLCKLLLRIVIRRSSLLDIVLACMYYKLHACPVSFHLDIVYKVHVIIKDSNKNNNACSIVL